MNIEQLKIEKKRKKITLQQISDISGIPKRTVDDIFSGHTKNPRVDTVQAIERALGLSTSNFTDEDYANGVTDKARIEVNTRQYEWIELGDEIIETKGEEYYKVVFDMLKSAIKQK